MTRPSPGLVRRGTAAALVAAVALAVLVPTELLARLATGNPPATPLWLLAALAVAVLVPALRDPIDRVADRAAYGPGGNPYAVVSGFVRRVGETLPVDEVLPHLARTAAEAVHGPSGEVRLWLADGDEWRQQWAVDGDASATMLSVPVSHGGEPLGELGVAVPAEEGARAAQELLAQLAGPAGLALSHVRLTLDLRRRLAQEAALAAELQRSRERLVLARTEQRRRFAHDVESRVQVPLARLDEALARVGEGAGSLDEAGGSALAALEALRELAHGVYPPVLGARGLAAALEMYDENLADDVRIDARALRDRRFGTAAETTAYLCAVLLCEESSLLQLRLSPVPVGVELSAELQTAAPQALEDALRDRVEAVGGTLTWTAEAADGSSAAARMSAVVPVDEDDSAEDAP